MSKDNYNTKSLVETQADKGALVSIVCAGDYANQPMMRADVAYITHCGFASWVLANHIDVVPQPFEMNDFVYDVIMATAATMLQIAIGSIKPVGRVGRVIEFHVTPWRAPDPPLTVIFDPPVKAAHAIGTYNAILPIIGRKMVNRLYLEDATKAVEWLSLAESELIATASGAWTRAELAFLLRNIGLEKNAFVARMSTLHPIAVEVSWARGEAIKPESENFVWA